MPSYDFAGKYEYSKISSVEDRDMEWQEREIEAREAQVERAIKEAEAKLARRRAKRRRRLELRQVRLAAKEAILVRLMQELEQTAEFATEEEEPRRSASLAEMERPEAIDIQPVRRETDEDMDRKNPERETEPPRTLEQKNEPRGKRKNGAETNQNAESNNGPNDSDQPVEVEEERRESRCELPPERTQDQEWYWRKRGARGRFVSKDGPKDSTLETETPDRTKERITNTKRVIPPFQNTDPIRNKKNNDEKVEKRRSRAGDIAGVREQEPKGHQDVGTTPILITE